MLFLQVSNGSQVEEQPDSKSDDAEYWVRFPLWVSTLDSNTFGFWSTLRSHMSFSGWMDDIYCNIIQLICESNLYDTSTPSQWRFLLMIQRHVMRIDFLLLVRNATVAVCLYHTSHSPLQPGTSFEFLFCTFNLPFVLLIQMSSPFSCRFHFVYPNFIPFFMSSKCVNHISSNHCEFFS